MLNDDSLRPRWIGSIIQRRRAPRTREGREAGAERGLLREDLSHQDIRPLGAAPEAALPHQLAALPDGVRLERRSEHLMKSSRSASVTALGATADHDPEAAFQSM